MTTTTTAPVMIREKEFCSQYGVPVQTARNWRYLGRGPKVTRIGRAIYYRRVDLDAWIESLGSVAA